MQALVVALVRHGAVKPGAHLLDEIVRGRVPRRHGRVDACARQAPGSGGDDLGRPCRTLICQVCLRNALVRTATVELDHCGFKPLDVDGKLWEVVAPPFDATNAPDQWQGRGEIVALDSSRLIFGDDSGLEVTFTPMTVFHHRRAPDQGLLGTSRASTSSRQIDTASLPRASAAAPMTNLHS